MLHDLNSGGTERRYVAKNSRYPGSAMPKTLTKAQQRVRDAMLTMPGCKGTVTDISKALNGGKYVHAEREILYRVLRTMAGFAAVQINFNKEQRCSSFMLTHVGEIIGESNENKDNQSSDIEEIGSLVDIY